MTSPNSQTYLVLIGPPGAGKGTQADLLEQNLGLKKVSSGDLFRENLKIQTPLGRLAQQYMDRGELVPDAVTIDMIKERITRSDCRSGVILDGFPRTLEQAQALEDMLASLGTRIHSVPLLTVPDEELIRRLTGRRVCQDCGASYHVMLNPPRQAGVCDRCGGELYQRSDDTEETVRNRLYVYYKQTSPLVGYYFAKGLLVKIDGMRSIEEIQRDLVDAIQAARPAMLQPG
jgi:adenylate kinase